MLFNIGLFVWKIYNTWHLNRSFTRLPCQDCQPVTTLANLPPQSLVEQVEEQAAKMKAKSKEDLLEVDGVPNLRY